ncbi:ABC transporter ATP-binding protein [Salibacterium aidingense]|uniref:ABC transporter ATP-binding protein n=1 Tax=Salibacterium aidingense TaxID=384933 RepID=UPI003BD31706
MNEKLLEIKDMTTVFKTDEGAFPAVNEVNLTIDEGEVLCVVGESGSGKTITSLSLMQLLPPNGEISSGKLLFNGTDLTLYDKKGINKIRGNQISMIFQDPMSSLDPVYTCGSQISEAMAIHENTTKKDRYSRTIQLLNQVGIPHPESVYHAYPHELSGGMCQRVMIAIALSCNPNLLIADEPTTALDVTVQAQILKLLNKIKNERNMGILFITHDLGVVAEMADKVAVMYGGQIVELCDVYTLFNQPKHPYTKGLIKSVPNLKKEDEQLYSIPGMVPSITSMPSGCRFHPRCPISTDRCRQEEPLLEKITSQHEVRCWHKDKEA